MTEQTTPTQEQTTPQLWPIRNAQWADAGQTICTCEVEHPTYGWIPFTASAADSEKQGRDTHAAILAGAAGPIAAYVPPQPPSTEQLAQEARAQRNALLAACDWTQLPDAQAALSTQAKAEWAAYRQALRDITSQAGFPVDVVWPTPVGAA